MLVLDERTTVFSGKTVRRRKSSLARLIIHNMLVYVLVVTDHLVYLSRKTVKHNSNWISFVLDTPLDLEVK